MVYQFVSFLGLFVMIGLAWAVSENRRAFPWKLVLKGLLLQAVLAVLVLYVDFKWTSSSGVTYEFSGKAFFEAAGKAVSFVLDANKEGTKFVFGDLSDEKKFGFIFFVQITGTIILVSALMSALYYLRVMQWVVWGMAWVMQRVMGTSGSESLASAANVFVGQTEAPLVIKPYLPGMTRSEVMALMVGGMANVAGGVLVAYVGMLQEKLPDIAGHLLMASVLSAPASLLLAKVIVPETQPSETQGKAKLDTAPEGENLVDCICRGATDGLMLSLNVMAMLIAFIGLVWLLNQGLGGIGWAINQRLTANGFDTIGVLSFERILGWLFMPLALALGIPWNEAGSAGALIGVKTVLNEFMAFQGLAEHQSGQFGREPLSRRTAVIVSYALCGFANFSSIAIQVGGIGVLVPSKRKELARMGLKAMFGGLLSSCMTACFAGALTPVE